MTTTPDDGRTPVPGLPWRTQLLLMAELGVATWLVHRFAIEGEPLLRLMMLAVIGFAVNPWLPVALRQYFFVLLSLVAVVLTFGVADGAWLVGSGLILIGCCHLPVRMSIRVILLLALGATLALSRAGIVPSAWSAVVWPVLGSIFMFRLVIYLRAVSADRANTSLSSTLAYFFMFPNLVFPLYPVIDYKTFRKSHYDRPEWETYEKGVLWIARGLMHLMLYRVVYHYVVNDPADVVRLSDLVRYMLGTFLLYLRVSGQFHLIVGLLYLFGYRLPETHHLYYLSQSFTDIWRRINIYWKDFMLQVVFYPAYFRLKGAKPAVALGLSTAAVFLATWILHSYQWFWLRGGFPITLPDILFWGILGGLVVIGALRESTQSAKGRRPAGWQLRPGLRAAGTFGAFCVLWSLWSTESVGQWLWMLGAAVDIDVPGVLMLGGAAALLVVLGGWNWDLAPPSISPRLRKLTGVRARTLGTLGVLLLIALPSGDDAAPGSFTERVVSLRDNRLNALDAALQHRGYYEQLEVREHVGVAGSAAGAKPAGWQDLGSIGVIRETKDALTRDLFPSRRVVWNGNVFSTNRWGMRDRDYEVAKPVGTFRIAILGPSHVMGNGVADDETFDELLEARLNAAALLPGVRRVEVLNFGIDAFSLSQQVALLEDRVLAFSPDVVIATHYHQNRLMTEGYLLKLVTRGIAPADERIARLLDDARLTGAERGSLPIPFAPVRAAARAIGLDPRMPAVEMSSRARRISSAVLAASFERFAEVSRAAGVAPLVLALNDVLDGVGTDVPHDEGIRSARLPVINLLDAYPEARRRQLRVGPWDNHPNAAGHRLIADRLYPPLTEFLLALPPVKTADAASTYRTTKGRT